MRSTILLLLIATLAIPANAADPPPPQVEIEAEIIEVEEDEFFPELGIEWGFGPSISHFTNTGDPDQINVAGLNAFVGIDWYFHPFLSFFGHMNIAQFGNGTEFFDGYNKIRYLNIGVDAGLKVHVRPGAKVDGFFLVGMDFGGNVSGVVIDKQNGVKDKVRYDLRNDENRTFAGATGGAGVTVRTDVVDFTIQATVTGGLTQVYKNPIENTPRSVPFFAEIPVIIRYMGRSHHRNRENIILLLEPQIIEDEID